MMNSESNRENKKNNGNESKSQRVDLVRTERKRLALKDLSDNFQKLKYVKTSTYSSIKTKTFGSSITSRTTGISESTKPSSSRSSIWKSRPPVTNNVEPVSTSTRFSNKTSSTKDSSSLASGASSTARKNLPTSSTKREGGHICSNGKIARISSLCKVRLQDKEIGYTKKTGKVLASNIPVPIEPRRIIQNDPITKNDSHFAHFRQDKDALSKLLKEPGPVFKSKKPITIFNDPKVTYDRDEEIIADTLFIKGKQYHINEELQDILTDYKEMLKPVANIDSIIQRPAGKSKLAKKLKRRSSSGLLKNAAKPYILDIYTTEYLEEIMNYEFTQETKYILLKKSCKSNAHRIVVVDWLIKLLDQYDVHQSIFLMSIRIFDYVQSKVETSNTQLVAICAFWIALKYHTNYSFMPVHKIFSICGGKFTNNQILDMEKVILRIINFDLNISDPLDFLYFYLKQENLETNRELECATNFIIEYSTLFPQYSSIVPSLVADAAFFLGKTLLKCGNVDTYNSQYNDPKYVEFYVNLFLRQLKWLSEPNCPYREIINRYSGKDCYSISCTLLQTSKTIDGV